MTRLRTERSGVRILERTRDLSLLKSPVRFWGPPSVLFNGYRASVPGINRPGPEVNRSPLSRTAEVNECTSSYTPSWRVQRTFYLYLYSMLLCLRVSSRHATMH